MSSPASIPSRCALWLVWLLLCVGFAPAESRASLTRLPKVIAPDPAEQPAEALPFKLQIGTGILCGNDPVNRHDPLGLLDATELTEEAVKGVLKNFGKAAAKRAIVVGGAGSGLVAGLGPVLNGGAAIGLGYIGMSRAANLSSYGNHYGPPSNFGRKAYGGNRRYLPDGSVREIEEQDTWNLIPYTGPLYDGEYRDHEGNIRSENGEIVVEKHGTRRVSDAQRQERAAKSGAPDLLSATGKNGITLAWELGLAGEEMSKIVGPKVRIDSYTEAAQYRVPDQLTAHFLKDAKNVRELRWTSQLTDFGEFVRRIRMNNPDFRFILDVRQNTNIGPRALEMIETYGVEINRLYPAR